VLFAVLSTNNNILYTLVRSSKTRKPTISQALNVTVCDCQIDAHPAVCINLWKALCVYLLKELCINTIKLTHFYYKINTVRVFDSQLIRNTYKIPII